MIAARLAQLAAAVASDAHPARGGGRCALPRARADGAARCAHRDPPRHDRRRRRRHAPVSQRRAASAAARRNPRASSPPRRMRLRGPSRSPTAAASRSTNCVTNIPRSWRRAGQTPLEYLRSSPGKARAERYPGGVPDKVRQLLEHELELIAELHYEAYFLTVWDLVRFARSRNILVPGPRLGGQLGRLLLPGRHVGRSRPRSTCCSSGSSAASGTRRPTSTSTSSTSGARKCCSTSTTSTAASGPG